jgi:5'-3' exonuclease
MTVLAIDFMNQCHRARSGFAAGDYAVVYNFFRQFKSLIDQFKPTRVYVALEGRPTARRELLDEYKANRKVDENDPKHAELLKFFMQKDIIVELLNNYFPVSLVRHPTSEADDTIANIVLNSSTSTLWTIVSSDTDFIQLLQKAPHAKLYNPIRKEYVEAPSEYDYVTWKALRGDSSDNIPGIPGIGDKTATKIASDPQLLQEKLNNPEFASIFTRNYDLIDFIQWSDDEMQLMTSSTPTKDWATVKSKFLDMNFKSFDKPAAWDKFVSSFDSLWS